QHPLGRIGVRRFGELVLIDFLNDYLSLVESGQEHTPPRGVVDPRTEQNSLDRNGRSEQLLDGANALRNKEIRPLAAFPALEVPGQSQQLHDRGALVGVRNRSCPSAPERTQLR